MKTKNFLLTGALLIVALFSVNGVMAEGPAISGHTNVTISLKPMQAITVNQSNVLLEYADINDYSKGVETDMENHLTVHSVGPFTVRVKADDANFKLNESNVIPLSDVKITATPAGGSTDTPSPVTLSTTATALITSTSGGMNLGYDVNYSTKEAGNAFKYAAKEGGDYTAKVTYTIAAN